MYTRFEVYVTLDSGETVLLYLTTCLYLALQEFCSHEDSHLVCM